jgi:hypothetical protein
MSKKTTYYALVNEFSSRERPGGVLRRVEDDEGQEDEAFTRNLAWEPTSLLYSAERGNLDNKFHEITEDEAGRIVARIRASVAEAPEGAP